MKNFIKNYFDQKSFPITFSFSNLKTNVRLLFDGLSEIIVKTPSIILLVPFFLPKVDAQSQCIESDSVSYDDSYYVDWKNQATILIKYLPTLKTLTNGDCGFEEGNKSLGNYSLIDCNCLYNESGITYNQKIWYGQNLTEYMQTCITDALKECSSDNSSNYFFLVIGGVAAVVVIALLVGWRSVKKMKAVEKSIQEGKEDFELGLRPRSRDRSRKSSDDDLEEQNSSCYSLSLCAESSKKQNSLHSPWSEEDDDRSFVSLPGR